MQIAIISILNNKCCLKLTDCVPRVGDSVGMFYTPMPKVTDVVWWPHQEEIKKMIPNNVNVDVIVFVE
jgi:hypothetical protein